MNLYRQKQPLIGKHMKYMTWEKAKEPQYSTHQTRAETFSLCASLPFLSLHLWLARWLLTHRTESREPLPGWAGAQSRSPNNHKALHSLLNKLPFSHQPAKIQSRSGGGGAGGVGARKWPPIRLIRPFWIWLIENTRIRQTRQNHPFMTPWRNETPQSVPA